MKKWCERDREVKGRNLSGCKVREESVGCCFRCDGDGSACYGEHGSMSILNRMQVLQL